METWPMKRGDTWWVNFDPSVGGEIRKQRPAVIVSAVIVSSEEASKYLNRVQVVPLFCNIGRVYTSEALVTVSDKQSKAMADQSITVSIRSLINQAGRLGPADLRRVEHAVRVQLGWLDTPR